MPDSNLTKSRPGDLWVAPVNAIPSVLIDFGIDPHRAFSRASVNLKSFEASDSRMPIEDIGRLLDTCVALTKCPHFGLLVGERFKLSNLGPVGQHMLSSATVGSAMQSLLKYLPLYDRGAALILLTNENSSVTLGYSMYRHGLPGVAYALDAVVAIGYRILQALCGPAWKPLRVQFACKEPGDIAKHRSMFRSSVIFDSSAWK